MSGLLSGPSTPPTRSVSGQLRGTLWGEAIEQGIRFHALTCFVSGITLVCARGVHMHAGLKLAPHHDEAREQKEKAVCSKFYESRSLHAAAREKNGSIENM